MRRYNAKTCVDAWLTRKFGPGEPARAELCRSRDWLGHKSNMRFPPNP